MKSSGIEQLAATVLQTPIGALRLVASARGLRRIEFGAAGARAPRATSSPEEARAHLARAAGQLREYFAGRRRAFDLALDLEGSDYQRRVWRALGRIPAGRTLAYGQVAAQLGRPGGARAVGRACATNPLPIVVPCHRVLDSAGGLHGYGGGLWRKERLLALEGLAVPKAEKGK